MSSTKGNVKATKPVTDWKNKALQRAKDSKLQNKRIRELAYSRDTWKSKYITQKREYEHLERELSGIKKTFSAK